MKTLFLILLTVLSTACGRAEEKDHDGAPPRLIALNVEHDPDEMAQVYRLIIEGRTSVDTLEQHIAYEISASIMEDEEPESCTTGDVRLFYQQEVIEVEPESKYYIKACSINKTDGTISPELMKVVQTEEMPEDPMAEFEDDEEVGEDYTAPLCVQEPGHVLCSDPDVCEKTPSFCYYPEEI